MNDRAQQIAALHAEYQRLTGLQISLMGREWAWFEWVKRGLTVADLRALIAEKRRRIRAGELPKQSLAFRNLVNNADYAEEDIAELRARARGRVPTDPARDAALRATGRPGQNPQPASEPRPAGAVAQQIVSDPAAAVKAFEEFKRFKHSL